MQGTILFGHSGVSGGIQERLAEFIGVGKADMPTMRILHPGETMNKYKYEPDVAPLSTDDVKNWVNEWKAGNLEPHRKSEPVPETNDGPVKVLVGKNFDDIVMDPTKDVFVKYYAPWCGHCKTLAPEYKKAAKELEDKPVRIAMIDATANDYPQKTFNVQGFPTLYWFPKATREPVQYEGGRTAADIQKFIEEKLA